MHVARFFFFFFFGKKWLLRLQVNRLYSSSPSTGTLSGRFASKFLDFLTAINLEGVHFIFNILV